MKGSPVTYLAGWTAWLAALTALLWALSDDPLPPALLSASALGWGCIALASAWRGSEPGERTVIETSMATLIAVAGFVAVVLGAVFGLWLTLIGAEVLAAAAVWIWLETRGRRTGEAP